MYECKKYIHMTIWQFWHDFLITLIDEVSVYLYLVSRLFFLQTLLMLKPRRRLKLLFARLVGVKFTNSSDPIVVFSSYVPLVT